MRFSLGFEYADMLPADGSQPSTATFVIARTSARVIPAILLAGCEAQIIPAIVSGIGINVIDLSVRPFAGHVEPCKVVSLIRPIVDPDNNPAFSAGSGLEMSSDLTDKPLLEMGEPPELAGNTRIVGHALAQALSREYLLLSHICPSVAGWSGAWAGANPLTYR